MIIDQLNLNHVRIFECVFRTLSMTAAARELHLTQSGVSQHIKAFEDVLGVKLFDRINQRVIPTSSAKLLYDKCKKNLGGLEEAFAELQAEKNQLAGRVNIGLPTEFGNNIVMPMISKFSKKYPQVKFHFHLGYGPQMNDLLLQGEVDFAFVDDFAMDKKIYTQPVYDETLELCVSPEMMKRFPSGQKHDRKFFESLAYVDFSKDGEIVSRWFEHHLDAEHLRINLMSTIEDAYGISRLISAGVGAGIIPGHLVTRLQKNTDVKFHVFKGKSQPLVNSISVAYLKDRSQSRSCQAALEFLLSQITRD